MIREFFAWWFGQLAELLPQGLRRTALTAVDAMVIKPIGPLGRGIEAVAIGLRRNGRETPLGRFGLGTTDLAEFNQVLGFEMDRETPFKPEEIYWNHRIDGADRQNGRLSVRLVLLPKANLAPLLTALGRFGIRPRRAEIADGPDAGAYLPLEGDGGRTHHPSNRLMWSAAVCCAVLGLAVVVIPFVRQQIALASLEQQIAVGRTAATEADSLRQEIDRLAGSADFIESERDKAGRPLVVLAAATRVLPDDTYLTEMELQKRKVTLTGRSAAAARLIGPLAADGTFRNPGFTAPVTRVEALHTELFTINSEVAP